MDLTKLEFHELANQFPLLSDEETRELANDIKKHGLEEPLTLLGGQILDGRNRYEACKIAGYKLSQDDVVQFEEEYEGADPVAFVITKNIRRRHLTVGQRNAAGAELFKRLQAAKKGVAPENQRSAEEPPERAHERFEKNISVAAKESGASVSGVREAVTVLNAAPDLHQQLKSGEATMPEVQKEVKRRKAIAKPKPSEEVYSCAVERLKTIWKGEFWEHIEAGRVPGLGSPADEKRKRKEPYKSGNPALIVELASKPDAEMQALATALYWGGLSWAEAQKFYKERANQVIDETWGFQHLWARMGAETQIQDSIVTLHGTYWFTFKRSPTAPAPQEESRQRSRFRQGKKRTAAMRHGK